MGLKYKVAKLEEVPEALRSQYKQEGEAFVLDVEGVVARERLDEFRNNNIALQQQIDKFKNIDPAKHAELLELQRQLNEGELLKAGKIDEVVNGRVAAMRSDLEGQLNTTKSELTTAQTQLAVLMIDNAVRAAAAANGVLPTAVDDLILRARTVYSMSKEGQPVPKNDKGEVIYGKDATSPLAIGDWVIGVKKTAPHLFAGTSGSGAGGGRGTPGVDVSKMTPTEKIAYGLSQGLNGLRNLPGAQ
jgi:hypothetical protein